MTKFRLEKKGQNIILELEILNIEVFNKPNV